MLCAAYSFGPGYGSAAVCETPAPRELRNYSDDELTRVREILRRITAIRIRNCEDAEDLVQETLLTMAMKCPHSEIPKGLVVWSMAILRNKVGNYYQKCRRMADLSVLISASMFPRRPPESECPELPVRHEELLALVGRIVSKFPPAERDVLGLLVAGLQTGEIVSEMRPDHYQNVVTRLHRGRRKLAKALRKYGY